MAKKISLGEGKRVYDFLFNIHTDTKVEELEILKGFLQRLQFFDFQYKEQERPDISLDVAGLKIGVEITKYYADFTTKGSRMQRKFMHWKKFAQKLKNTIEENYNEFSNIYASIHFKENEPNYELLLNSDYLKEIIKSLKIFQNSEYNKATLKLSHDEFPFLSKYIDQFFFEHKSDNDDFLWWNSTLQSGKVEVDESSLKNIISNKENKSKEFKSNYHQKWLLIYAAGIGLADIFPEFTNIIKRQGTIMLMELESNNSEFESKSYSIEQPKYFTHIFVWDKFHEKIFLIYPNYKKLLDYGEGKIWVNHLPINS